MIASLKDLDIGVEPTPENAAKVWRALAGFGAPLDNLTVAGLSNPDMIYQMGVEPNRIDLIMAIKGLQFAEAWEHRVINSYDDQQDRSFDLEFWDRVGAAGRFEAAWQMLKEVQLLRGQSAELPRMQKNVTRVLRRSQMEHDGQSDD